MTRNACHFGVERANRIWNRESEALPSLALPFVRNAPDGRLALFHVNAGRRDQRARILFWFDRICCWFARIVSWLDWIVSWLAMIVAWLASALSSLLWLARIDSWLAVMVAWLASTRSSFAWLARIVF